MANGTTFSVTGAVTTPLTGLDATTLASDFTPVTININEGGQTVTYAGVSLYNLINTAKFQFPGAPVKNGFLRDYVLVTGSGGESVVVAEGEIDPGFGGAVAALTDIVAYQRDGTTIAPTLILPGDVNGSIGGRDIVDIASIQVATASVPTPPAVTNPPPTVTLNGNVTTPGTSYTVAQVQALTVSAQTDTFLQGSTPKTFTFTGTPLLTLLNSNGLTDTTSLMDDYIVATGSDGYGIVYSMGEIDPNFRSGNVALVAYDDGTGAFPSISGGSGLLRTTAPFDSKGGRYVSNLETISVSSALPCFARGTRISTPGGSVLVEDARPGDLVLTATGDALPIRWTGRRHVDCDRHSRPAQVWPVRVLAGAFGDGAPNSDLYLSPDHAVYVDDVLIPVKYLINGSTIVQSPHASIEYFHLELEKHDIVVADGLAVESFLDTGQKAAFSNGGGILALHPDFSAAVWEAEGCAPIVVSGPVVEAVRRCLGQIAARRRLFAKVTGIPATS